MSERAAGVGVRELAPADWRVFRTLRLAALADSPDAFSSTSEREGAFPDETWASRLAPSVTKASFVAELGGEPVGIVHAQIDASRPARAWLMAMWVSPSARRHGVGRALVGVASRWARLRGASVLALQVTDGNRAAECLYAASGFRPTGDTEPLRAGSSLLVRTLELPLG